MKIIEKKKVGRPKKIPEKPLGGMITIILKLIGQDQKVECDNVLEGLRKIVVDSRKIKSYAIFTFEFNDKRYDRMYRIPQFKRYLSSFSADKDLGKKLLAKTVNIALGLQKDNQNLDAR